MSHDITEAHMRDPKAGDVFESNDYQTKVTIKKVQNGRILVEETYSERGEKRVLERAEFPNLGAFQSRYSYEHAPGYTIHYLDNDGDSEDRMREVARDVNAG